MTQLEHEEALAHERATAEATIKRVGWFTFTDPKIGTVQIDRRLLEDPPPAFRKGVLDWPGALATVATRAVQTLVAHGIRSFGQLEVFPDQFRIFTDGTMVVHTLWLDNAVYISGEVFYPYRDSPIPVSRAADQKVRLPHAARWIVRLLVFCGLSFGGLVLGVTLFGRTPSATFTTVPTPPPSEVINNPKKWEGQTIALWGMVNAEPRPIIKDGRNCYLAMVGGIPCIYASTPRFEMKFGEFYGALGMVRLTPDGLPYLADCN